MKKFILIVFMVFSATASSTTVILTSDKTELMLNETITFHIEVYDIGSSGGGFTIMKEVEKNRFKLVGGPYFTSSCTMCRGVSRLGDLNEDFRFTPREEGNYMAEANYGGIQRRIEFRVYSPTTTTTPTSTTTISTSTTTTITSTSTTTSTSTSAVSTSTTATIPTPPEKGDSMAFYVLGFVLLLIVLSLIYKAMAF